MPDSYSCQHVKLSGTIRTAKVRKWNKSYTHIKHRTERLAERVWCTWSQSSLLNIYFRFSAWLSVLAPTHLLPLRPEHPFTLRRRMAKHTKITVSCVWTTVLSGMVFVWAQELSGIGIVWKWRQSVIDFFSFCCRRWLGYWKIVLVETVEQLCSLLFHHLLLVTMRRWTRWDSQIKLKI